MNDDRAAHKQGEVRFGDVKPDGDCDSLKDLSSVREKTKEIELRELDNARYAALMSRAHSDQARALVVALTDLIATHELTVLVDLPNDLSRIALGATRPHARAWR